MNKRTIATSIFAASLGMTLLASPAQAMNGEGDIPENCISVPFTETVVITPETTEQRLVTPAVEAVVKIEVKYIHDKNDTLEPRWEVEGWNADDSEASQGWVATEETREVIVTPAVEAVYETVTIPAVTEERESHRLQCDNEVISGPGVPGTEEPTEETPADCAEGTVKAEDGSCVPTEYWEEEPVAETPAEETPAAEVPAQETPAAPVISAEVGTGEAAVTVQPQAVAVPLAVTTSNTPTELAYTGAADWALPMGGVALLGGAALFGAAKLRRRTV